MSKSKNKKRRSPADLEAQRAALAERDAKRRAEKKQRRRRRIRKVCVFIGAAAVLCAGGFGGYLFFKRSSFMLHRRTAVESLHYKVSQAELGAFFQQCVESYDAWAATSEDIVTYDPAVSLKKQNYTDGDTWYNMLMSTTLSNVQSILQMCEAAYDAGFTLPESEETAAKEEAEVIDLSRCPKGTTREDAENACRQRHIAISYQKAATEAISITDEEIEAGFEANRANYVEWEMLCSVLSYKGAETDAEDPTLRNAAKANADALQNLHTEAEFRALAETFLTEDQTPDSLHRSGTGFSYPDQVRDWVLGDEPPAVGDCLTVDLPDSQQYQVWQLLTLPARDESETVDLRVCVLTADSYGDLSSAKAEAERLMEQCTENGGTWENFGDIAAAYSEDAQTYPDGGELKGFSARRSAYGSKLNEWAFDASRKPGDMTVCVEDDFVVLGFFEADNPRCAWEYYVYSALYTSKTNDIQLTASAHSVTVNNKATDLPL